MGFGRICGSLGDDALLATILGSCMAAGEGTLKPHAEAGGVMVRGEGSRAGEGMLMGMTGD